MRELTDRAETAKAQMENAKLREVLARIGGFANSWIEQFNGHADFSLRAAVDRLGTIEQVCKAALEQPTKPVAPLTYVNVGGEIFAGNIVDPVDGEELSAGWVTIEVVDVDPTAGRMSVCGPLAGYASNKPPETVGVVS